MASLPQKLRSDGALADLDQSAIQQRVALAASHCAERGTRLTAIRQQVLLALWRSQRPLGAYELLEILAQDSARKIAPTTIYRALSFLIEQDLASKLESRNAYVPCSHPEHPHTCLFFICGDCGASTEIEDARVEELLREDAVDLGFQVTHRVVEVQGKCANCVNPAIN